jgi:hypothetical protein
MVSRAEAIAMAGAAIRRMVALCAGPSVELGVESDNVAEFQTQSDLRFATYLSNLDARFDALEAKLDLCFAERDAKIAKHFRVHARWMFGAWAITFLAVLSLWFRK